MNREKQTSLVHRTVLAMMFTALVVFAPATDVAHGQELSNSEVVDGTDAEIAVPQRVIRPKSRATAGAIALCVSSSDCNDGLPCTADLCVTGACMHLPIPDCKPCEISYTCPPVEIVFIMDTSGSMRDEAAALCATINGVVNELAASGVEAIPTALGITQTPGGAYACLFDTVVGFFGDAVPGNPGSCPFPNGSSPFESWGPATAIVAQNFPWRAGSTRIIVPISDEGPCNGSRPEGCNDPGDDRDSIDNAIAVALANNVIVSPIAGTGSDSCVINLGGAIAAATGGALFQTKNPKMDFPDTLLSIIIRHCAADDRCDDDDPCTANDRCHDGLCKGTSITGCQECFDHSDCDDANKCTNDTCAGGFCQWTPRYDPVKSCCEPSTGVLRTIDDSNACTSDACDPATGRVDHINLPQGTPCDDGQTCTVNDVCTGAGACGGVGIHTIPCQSDADCHGHICNMTKGYCACNGTPELCLEVERGGLPNPDCHSIGDEIVIHVRLGNSAETISGGQFLVGYDPSALEFLDVVPGHSVDPESPFGMELSRIHNATNGTIFYAVGVILGGPMTNGPAIMASLHFRTKSVCATESLCFLNSNPLNTRLTNATGHLVAFEPCCSEVFQITGEAPSLTCPANVSVNAEAGTLSAGVSWSPVSASISCNDTAQITCVASNSSGVNVDGLIPTGGRAPLGKTSFACTASDGCGKSGTCAWEVNVQALHSVEADIQLSPTVSSGPLRRCIEFAFYSNCQEPPVIVEKTIEFGLPYNLPGRADRVAFTIPPGQYTCATARDVKHSLRSRSPVSIVGGKYVVRFTGDPAMGGNWLEGGNFDGNGVIDAIDQALVMSQYLQTLPIHTPCGSGGFHSDINGDGIVNLDDFSFVQRNLSKTDAAPCCQGGTASSTEARDEVSLDELEAMGFGDLSAADLNGDGVMNQDDVKLLIRRESARMQSKKLIGSK